jgi:hypothetical protein
MTKYAFALLPLLMASTALANPATDAGAAHLTQVFQTYLGTTPGVVTVTPAGETYALAFDPTPLLKLLPDESGTISVSPIEYALTDNGDGTWGVTGDQPFSVISKMADGSESKADVARMVSEGVFDEKLMAFSRQTATMEGYATTTTQVLPENGGTLTSSSKTDHSEMTMTGTAGATGGVDVVIAATSTNMSGQSMLPPEAGMGSQPIAFRLATMSYDAKLTGLRSEGILGLLAFAVAHPEAEAEAKDEAKALITAAMPFFDNAVVQGSAKTVAIDTPVGPTGIDTLGFTMDLNGGVAEGKLREAFSLEGVTPPPGILPDWAAPIFPQKLTLDVQVTGYDAQAGIAKALEGIDDKPDAGFDAQVQKAFFPTDIVTVTVNPSAITGAGYELTYRGDLQVNLQTEQPSGKALLTLKGYDALQAAMANAPDEVKMQAMMGLGMAQGLAKTEGDTLVWEIDASNMADVKINGTSLGMQ